MSTEHNPSPNSFWYRSILRLLVFCLLLLSISVTLGFRWPEEIATTDIVAGIAVVSPLMAISILLTGWRLSVLAGHDVTTRQGMEINAISQLIVLAVPSRISEAAKPVYLSLLCGLPMTRGFAVLAIERVLDAILLAMATVVALSGSIGPLQLQFKGILVAMTVIAAAGLAILVILTLHPSLVIKVAALLPVPALHKQANVIADYLVSLRDLRRILVTLALSILAWFASYLIFLFFFSIVLPVNLSAVQVLVVFVASTLGLIVAVAPAGLGTFEAAIVLTLGTFGIPLAAAISAAVIMRIALLLPVVLTAIWFIFTSDIRFKDVTARLTAKSKERE